MIVRELFARLGIKKDAASFGDADQSISNLKTGLKTLGAILATGAVARGLLTFTERASDAAEVTNVLGKVFQENAADVEEWGDAMATELGRSRFELKEMAGDLGKVIQPMLGSRKAAADMSTRLAQAAVDLASLNNETDPRALNAIRSGMVGMGRPLLDLGVNLNIATLEAFALSRGITKSFQSMTIAEKLTLRYEAIIHQSANAHGDAADTSEEYANATKGLAAGLRDLSTMIGQSLLPGATKFVTFTRDAVRGLEELLRGTKFIEVALAGLGVIATIVGVQMLLPFLPAIAVAVALAAAFLLVAGAVEDVIIFFRGGESLIGRVLESWGVDTDALRGAFNKLWEAAKTVFDAIAKKAGEVSEKMGPRFKEVLSSIGDAFGRFVVFATEKFISFADKVGPFIDSLLEFDVEGAIAQVSAFFSEFGGKIKTFLASPAGKILVALLGAYLGRKAGAAAGSTFGAAAGKFVGSSRIPGSKAAGEFIGKHLGGLLGSVTGAVAGGAGAVGFTGAITQSPQAAAASGGASLVNAPTTSIEVNVTTEPGQDADQLATKIGDTVDRKLADRNKAALQMLTAAKTEAF